MPDDKLVTDEMTALFEQELARSLSSLPDDEPPPVDASPPSPESSSAAPTVPSAATEKPLPGWEEYAARFQDLPPEQVAVLRERFQLVTDSLNGKHGSRIQTLEREREQYRQERDALLQRALSSPATPSPATTSDPDLAEVTEEQLTLLNKVIAKTPLGQELQQLRQMAQTMQVQQAEALMSRFLDEKAQKFADIQEVYAQMRPHLEATVRQNGYNQAALTQWWQTTEQMLDTLLEQHRTRAKTPAVPRGRPGVEGPSRGGGAAPSQVAELAQANTMADILALAARMYGERS